MIIGLTGTHGAGKGTVSRILVERGFNYLRFSDVLRKECDLRGLEKTRQNLINLSYELIKLHGKNYLAQKLYDNMVLSKSERFVLDGFRRVEEIDFFRKRDNFFLIKVDAPRRIRYERILKRNESTDHITFDEFVNLENQEMNNPENMEISKCMEMADFILINDSTIEALRKKVDRILEKIL